MATPPTEEADREKAADVAPVMVHPSGSNGRLYLILVALLLLLPLLGWALVYFVLGPRVAEARTKSGSETVETTSAVKEDKEAGPKSSNARVADGEGFALLDLVVNIKGTHGTRFLRCSKMSFDAPDAVLAELRSRKDQVADIVSSAMSSKKMDDVDADDAKTKLKIEIITLVNSMLKAGEISNIYLTDYVIQ